jgi:hypothetical protein
MDVDCLFLPGMVKQFPSMLRRDMAKLLTIALLAFASAVGAVRADEAAYSELSPQQIHKRCIRIAIAADYGDYKKFDPTPGYFQVRFDPKNQAIINVCNQRINTAAQLWCVKQRRIVLRQVDPTSTTMNRAFVRGEKNFHKVALDPNEVAECGG